MTALRQMFTTYADRNLSPEARSARIAMFARAKLVEVQQAGKAPDKYTRFVDGREGAPETAVRGTGGGVIVYQFAYAGDAAVYALEFLRHRAPEKTGEFVRSFFVSVNGRFVPASQFDPKLVPAGATILIGNTQPQDRKIDVQFNNERRIRFSVPPGMWPDCVRYTSRRFRGVLTVKRVRNITFPGQYVSSKKGNKIESPGIEIGPVV